MVIPFVIEFLLHMDALLVAGLVIVALAAFVFPSFLVEVEIISVTIAVDRLAATQLLTHLIQIKYIYKLNTNFN